MAKSCYGAVLCNNGYLELIYHNMGQLLIISFISNDTFLDVAVGTGIIDDRYQSFSSLSTNVAHMETWPQQLQTDSVFLSVVSGTVPGIAMQTSEISEGGSAGKKTDFSYFTSSDTMKQKADWMAVDDDAYQDEHFQHGSVTVKYDVFEKCVNITFSEVMQQSSTIIV